MEDFFEEFNIRLVFSGSTFRWVFEWIYCPLIDIIVVFAGKELYKTGNFSFIARKYFIIQFVEQVIQR